MKTDVTIEIDAVGEPYLPIQSDVENIAIHYHGTHQDIYDPNGITIGMVYSLTYKKYKGWILSKSVQ